MSQHWFRWWPLAEPLVTHFSDAYTSLDRSVLIALNMIIPCGCQTPLWTLRWRHNGHNSVSNHQPHHCLLNRLFRRRSKKTPKLRVTGLCVGNSPGTGEFPAQMASYAESVSIWWRHHDEWWQWSDFIAWLNSWDCFICHNVIISNLVSLVSPNIRWYYTCNSFFLVTWPDTLQRSILSFPKWFMLIVQILRKQYPLPSHKKKL